MNIKELMIGDWVLHDGKPKRVDVNWGNAVSPYDPSKTWGSIYADKFSEGFEGIPLTEELLQKHFPDPSEIVWFPLDEMPGFFNIYWEHPSFGDGELRLNIQYVHELQHIVRMVGLTKEIEL